MMGQKHNPLKPRATKLWEAMQEKKGGPHIPKHLPVVRSRENNKVRRELASLGY